MLHLALQPQALSPRSLELLLQLLCICCASVGGGSGQRCCLRLLQCGLKAGDIALRAGDKKNREAAMVTGTPRK